MIATYLSDDGGLFGLGVMGESEENNVIKKDWNPCMYILLEIVAISPILLVA